MIRIVPACMFLSLALAASGPAAAITRTYYLAAEETLWDYAPSYPINPMHNGKFTADEKVFVAGDQRTRIGHRYYKARYVEYTDASFTTPKARPPEWQHLGLLGPVLRANVGDTLKVVLKNKTKRMPVSLHPHGLLYHKDSEGSLTPTAAPARTRGMTSCPWGRLYLYVGSPGAGRARSRRS